MFYMLINFYIGFSKKKAIINTKSKYTYYFSINIVTKTNVDICIKIRTKRTILT